MNIYIKLSVLFTFISFCEKISSQTLEVEYEAVMTTTIQMNINNSVETHTSLMTQEMVLLSNDGISLYESMSSYKGNKEKSKYVGSVSGITLNMRNDNSKIYRNQASKELISQKIMFDKGFLIIDKMKIFDWNLLNEDEEINGYKCKKAVTGDIVAWYCPDIPVNDGPDIFWGLPGLILKLQYQNIIITAIKVNQLDNNIIIEKPEKGKKTTRKAFDKLYEKKLKQRGNSPQQGIQLNVEITAD
jgi:GLPGLI family protein